MKVKLLIATIDAVYAKLLSDHISEHHADSIDISVCSTLERIQETLSGQRYDAALIDSTLINSIDTCKINLPLLLWSEDEKSCEISPATGTGNKYQRRSKIIAAILEKYAGVSKSIYLTDSKAAVITAVWSPAGGVGKTTVALSYAMSCVSEGRSVFYLNLEDFSGVPGYLGTGGKSISSVFEMLDTQEGNIKMLIRAISSHDKGITYLCEPDNFDDMCVLSSDNIRELVRACAELSDELVIDLSCSCDIRTCTVFDIADRILIVTEQTTSAEYKLNQFTAQNNIFERIKDKTAIVANKGASITDPPTDNVISLPHIQANDAISVCGVLSGYYERKGQL